MPPIRVKGGRGMTAAIKRNLIGRLKAANIGQVLVANAKRRIDRGGDSEHKYPDMWKAGYRAGGQPLRDTSRLFNSLEGHTRGTARGVIVSLRSDQPHAQYHQHGFSTDGPNFIPLNRKAARKHVNGADPKEEGLVLGEDYIMAWKGVTVPQRKIYNDPPEDREAIAAAVSRALGAR